MRITYRQPAADNEIFAEGAFDSQIGKIILINFRETEEGKIVAPVGEARLLDADILEGGRVAELSFEILNFNVGADVPDASLVRAGGMSFAFKDQP